MAALPGAGGMGLLVFDAARSFWGADDHGAGLDLDASEPFVGSYWSGSGVSWSMFMIVTLSSQATDFFCFGGGVSSTVSTV